VGYHHQAPGETEPVSSAGDRAFIGQVLGDFLEPFPDEPVEGLQKEYGLTESVEKLPGRIAARQVGQFVCEKTFLVFECEIADPFGTADFRLPDARGERHRDRCRRAQANRFPETHGESQAVEKSPSWTEASRLEQSSEVQDRASEDQ
jgi:hypothetical protein